MPTTEIRTITSHAVGVIIVSLEDAGIVHASRMPYTRKGSTTIRQPMETGELGESIMQSLNVLMLHEVADDAANFEWKLVQTEPILVNFKEDEKNIGGTHVQPFFLAVVTKGKVRSDRSLPDGEELLGPITLVEIGALIREIEGRTVPIHVKATKMALVSLAYSIESVHDRYKKIIGILRPQDFTEEELAAIAAYPGKW